MQVAHKRYIMYSLISDKKTEVHLSNSARD